MLGTIEDLSVPVASPVTKQSSIIFIIIISSNNQQISARLYRFRLAPVIRIPLLLHLMIHKTVKSKMKLHSFRLRRCLLILSAVVVLFMGAQTISAFTPTRHEFALRLRSHYVNIPGPKHSILLLSNSATAFDEYSEEDPDQDLAYQDTLVGTGDVVAEDGLLVTVAYKGSLLSNGKVFDEGPGISFRLGDGAVIPGWERGIAGMKVGGTRTLKIPPRLAYGDAGAGGGTIPPKAHLIFECELKIIATTPTEEVMAQLKNLSAPTLLAIVLVVGNFLLLVVPH